MLGHNPLIQLGVWIGEMGCIHSSARRDIAIKFFLVVGGVFLFLLEWETIEVTTNRELAVDTLLGDVEILDVEEALLANSGDEGAGKLLPTFRSGVEGEVDGDQVGPVKICLQPRRFKVQSCGNEWGTLQTFVSGTHW